MSQGGEGGDSQGPPANPCGAQHHLHQLCRLPAWRFWKLSPHTGAITSCCGD